MVGQYSLMPGQCPGLPMSGYATDKLLIGFNEMVLFNTSVFLHYSSTKTSLDQIVLVAKEMNFFNNQIS